MKNFCVKLCLVLLSRVSAGSGHVAKEDAAVSPHFDEELLSINNRFGVASAIMTAKEGGQRGLQFSYCTLGDIEDDLAEEFDFYSRSGMNASGVSCSTGQDDICTTTVVTLLDDTGTNTTSTEIEQPCNTCTFSYPLNCTLLGDCTPSPVIDDCGELEQLNKSPYVVVRTPVPNTVDGRLPQLTLQSCLVSEGPRLCFTVDCGGDVDCIAEETDGNSNTTTPTSVEVCREVGRTDSFATTEFQQPDGISGQVRYGCQAENKKRTFTSKYTLGVTNFVETTMTLGQKKGEGDVEERFDTCELDIDGVKCNSCTICGQEEQGLLAVDCANVFDDEDATTSCDSLLDLILYGIDVEQKFMVLQEGYIPPTPSPTAQPTRPPTTGPASSSADARGILSRLFASISLAVVVGVLQWLFV